MKPIVFLCSAMLIAGIGCKSSAPASLDRSGTDSKEMIRESSPSADRPSTVVYKTTRDFSDYVPVIMDENQERIVSYPAPTDIYYKGQLAKPTALADGYWLDNRGINEHVAFLSYTYEEYSRLGEVPDIQLLESRIMERYPLLEMYDCGKRVRGGNEVEELNLLIKNGFPGCRKLSLPSKSMQ